MARGVKTLCALLAVFAAAMTAVPGAAVGQPGGYGQSAVNLLPTSPFGPIPDSATQPPSGQAEPVLATTVPVPTTPAATVKAGIASVDATWKVGASAGQYATAVEDNTSIAVGDHTKDPNILSIHRAPSYGIESRSTARALVVQGVDGKRTAVISADLYIAQDLLARRVAGILVDRDSRIKQGQLAGKPTGIDDTNMSMFIDHNHSSPFYSSTGWGVWTFQDVFDLRFYEFIAQKMADAVITASNDLRPVRMGAAAVPYDYTQRHSFGPQVGFDGTPAGYPKRDNDYSMSVMRFDDITDRAHPRPYAIWFIFGQHPEFLEGNNMLTGEWPHKAYRMIDDATGATSIFSQNNVGTVEEDCNGQTHALAVRAEFCHREYPQDERGARQIANAVIRGFNAVGTNRPSGAGYFLPYQRLDFKVDMIDRRYAPPLSHPYPSVSNCRTPAAFNGSPGIPLLGLPDCNDSAGALFGPVVGQFKGTPLDPGVTYTQLNAAGVPIPANYGAPSYTGLEETILVHMQAIRLGDVLVTVCPCEQWADQSRNIKSRVDTITGNQWLGWDWTQFCHQKAGGAGADWTCPNPQAVGDWNGDPRTPPSGGTLTITDYQVRQMHAQVVNDAAGWDAIDHAATAESEPTDPAQIMGNYTHTEVPPALGYTFIATTSHVNDYWGYIATYREYQRGDHYRKALTGLGAHSSDWLATRLVAMGAAMKEDKHPAECPAAATASGDYWLDKISYNTLDCAYQVDNTFMQQRAALLGRDAAVYLPAYEAALPDDGGTPGAVEQPKDMQRFDRNHFTWTGGSNYVDNPVVTLQREVSLGTWATQADSFGDIQTTLQYPADVLAETATYRTGSFQWKWTAHFEAFDSNIDTASFGSQTPSGTYRYVVDGISRHGNASAPYHVVSSTFAVRPWRGITVPDVRLDPGGTVSFTVGPTVTRRYSTQEYRGENDPTKVVDLQVGPIAYPDSYQTASEYPSAPETGNHLYPRVERNVLVDKKSGATYRYCFSCTFRPWAETATVASAQVEIANASGCELAPAILGADGRYHTNVALSPGQSAQVAVGSIRDTFGETNGTPSRTVTAVGGPAALPGAAGCQVGGLPSTARPYAAGWTFSAVVTLAAVVLLVVPAAAVRRRRRRR